MTYLGEILLILVNIAMAYYHACIFKDGGKVKHGWWGLAYLALTGLFAFLYHSWWLLIAGLLLRKLVFDISLNLFEGRSAFFVSVETTSIIDKFYYKVFKKNSELYQSIHFLLLVIINIFLL